MTVTREFGVSRRESHDASPFYGLRMLQEAKRKTDPKDLGVRQELSGNWYDRLYCQSSANMDEIPDNTVGLAFTSPPYNCGKTYDQDLSLDEWRDLLIATAAEVYRVLVPGGRYIVNVANVGRKPYIPLSMVVYDAHRKFNCTAEIIWQKAKGAGGSCSWGSWRKASAPSIRDIHEYLLVFTKGLYGRPDKGESTLGRDEFMESTLSIWHIPPESAKRIGHPAPFPIALAERVINLYSYKDDVVLDPFMGSGTTCVAAKQLGRHYVGYDISEEYVTLAEGRLA